MQHQWAWDYETTEINETDEMKDFFFDCFVIPCPFKSLMLKVRTIIVDDEKPARIRLRELLEKRPELEIVGECANGEDAVRRIRDFSPDLLYLDIQMPGVNGFGVLRQFGADQLPTTIFVTAYDQYALKAFEVCALDYLLKPYSDERFERSLARAIELVRSRQRDALDQRMQALLERIEAPLIKNPEPSAVFLDCLVVKNGGRVVFLPVEEIAWIEAAGVYVQLHTGTSAWLHRVSMNELESKLDPQRFFRLHRSTIVNIRKIKELQPQSHGDYLVVLQNGQELKLSRNYRAKLEAVLGQSL
jgi:two-component system, LytTR family, response regulator